MPPRPFSQPTAVETGGRPGQRPSFEHPHPAPARNNYDNASLEKAIRERAVSDLDGRKARGPERAYYDQPYHPSYGPLERQPLPPYHEGQHPGEAYHRMEAERRNPSPPTMQGVMNGPPRGYVAADLGPGPGPAILQEQQYPVDRVVVRPDHYDPRVPPQGPYGNGVPVEMRGSIVESGEHNNIDQRRSMEDHNHRSLLSLNNEYARRMERASPLPQAVQGAQSQPPDVGRDPGIKSEFGRMFSGLGSGIGSTPQPAHTPLKRPLTPSRTPAYEENGASRRHGQDMDVVPKPATSVPQTSARSAKRRYDDESRVESNGVEGRATPVVTTAPRGKRNKYTIPPGHHHHPLPVTHQ